MVDLNLDMNEEIILQTPEVVCYGEEELHLKELVLTNKNLIYVIERKKVFKKYIEIQKYSFDSLAKKDGHIDATIASFKAFDSCLKLQFKSGKEYIIFRTPSKKLITTWIVEINKAALGITVEIGGAKKKSFGSFLAKGFKKSLGIEQDEKIRIVDSESNATTITKQSNNTINNTQNAEINNKTNSSLKSENQFCHNCGSRISSGFKFCVKCGTPTINEDEIAAPAENVMKPATITNVSVENAKKDEQSQRKVEYVGKVLKCPNCGCVIGTETMLCPDCGMKINREEASGSIQTFYDRLMEIESNRKPKKNSLFVQVDPVDEQKLAFIRSYPIPNSIEDIVEFFSLAANNINVMISKNSFWNKLDDPSIEKQISDAWVVKMQQLYKKAQRMFPHDEAFLQIQDIYFSKMKELNIKV